MCEDVFKNYPVPEGIPAENVIPNGNYFKDDGYLYERIGGRMAVDGRDLWPIYNARFDKSKTK